MRKFLLLLLNFTIPLWCFSQQNKTALVNKGDMSIVGTGTTGTPSTIFVKGDFSATKNSTINMEDEGKIVLTGNFVNDVITGNVFGTRSGTIEFRGNALQYIRGNAKKTVNYINLPETVIINNQNTNPDSVAVVIDALMGVTVKDVTLSRGRLILDSKVNGVRQSDVAHLLAESGGNITYNRSGLKHEQGIVQVNLALGNNYVQKRLFGFTPPFQKIYADYFMFNFLSAPTNMGIFGNTGMLISDPRTPLTAGRGYIIGQGLIPESDPYYLDELEPEFNSATFTDRAKEKLSFSRVFAPASLTSFVNTTASIADNFMGEALCTTDVTVQLEKGFNYVGNPFTVPLNMSEFVQEKATVDDWGVTRAADGSGDVRNSFYVMSEGTGSYHSEYHFSQRFQFNISYLIGQAVGGTLTYDGGTKSLLIAPMQMFVVGRDNDSPKEMKIPISARKHGEARFLRSEPINTEVTDEILIETKDSQTGGYDRLCVVFRDNATTISNDPYDASKIFNKSGGVNQIYTKSLDSKSLTTNVIPPSVENLVMYFEPAKEEQEVSLGAYRLQSLSAVKQVILEDTKTGIKTDLIKAPNYTFISAPDDVTDRFVLHFSTRDATGIEEEQQGDNSNIGIHYHAGTITIQGLQPEHTGATFSIFALNGKKVAEYTIRETPVQQLETNLPTAAYVVKLVGDKTAVTKKLLVK